MHARQIPRIHAKTPYPKPQKDPEELRPILSDLSFAGALSSTGHGGFRSRGWAGGVNHRDGRARTCARGKCSGAGSAGASDGCGLEEEVGPDAEQRDSGADREPNIQTGIADAFHAVTLTVKVAVWAVLEVSV